ncbi:MAG: glycerophosphodiester phosphodiesterase [Promethearchaeota archaeon]
MTENKKNDYFVINSHRGVFKNGLLENSVPAFMESYYEGANCVECDIRITKDNEIILIHNKTIDHIVSFAEYIPEVNEFNEKPEGLVREHTFEYLKSIKFSNNARILNLSEFLDLLKKLKIGAQIELKEGGYEEKILKIFENADINYEEHIGPIVCTSFNWFAIKRLVKLSRKYRIPLYSHSGKKGLAFGFQAIPLGSPIGKFIIRKFHKMNIWGGMTHYKYIPIKRLEYAHKYGVKFCPRIPDNKELALAYLKAGVDGFETDNIPFIRECVIEARRGDELPPIPKK